jgi:hypothetical protein
MGTWGLVYGEAVMYYTYDAVVTLGIKDPSIIKLSRQDDVISIDVDSIVIDVLDTKIENRQLVGVDNSNWMVTKTISIETIFDSDSENKVAAEEFALLEENKKAALDNFVSNYTMLCKQLDLEVISVRIQ